MQWLYESPIGTINIIQIETGSFSIIIDNHFYGRYSSAGAAADDVYIFSTGCYDWDIHCADIEYQLNVPTDIHEWNLIK